MKIRIVYPEDRMIDEKVLIGWAQDKWMDNPSGPIPTLLNESIDFLEDFGMITVTRPFEFGTD